MTSSTDRPAYDDRFYHRLGQPQRGHHCTPHVHRCRCEEHRPVTPEVVYSQTSLNIPIEIEAGDDVQVPMTLVLADEAGEELGPLDLLTHEVSAFLVQDDLEFSLLVVIEDMASAVYTVRLEREMTANLVSGVGYQLRLVLTYPDGHKQTIGRGEVVVRHGVRHCVSGHSHHGCGGSHAEC